MNKLLAFLSYEKVVIGIYIITGVSIAGAVTSLNGLISAEHLIILVIVMLVAWGLPVIIGVTSNRRYCSLFVNASEIANCYSDGESPKSELKHQIQNKQAEVFINSFNQLVSGALLTRGMFSEVSLRLGLDAKNLSSTSAEISQMMAQQLNSTAHVQETIDNLQAAVNLASEVASSTYELASKSEREGASGKQVMTEAICGVMTLSDSVNSAGEIIQTLGEDSKSIGGIIDVITGVAEQTNLLALNAAIEAARAGEQGRGFAVVADEVRSLASKTQESASKIHNIINLLLGHVDEAVIVINNSVEQADNADGLMEGVTVSYSEIVGLMVEVASHSSKLLDSSKQSENSANEAAASLNDIMESSQRSILKANILITESMELGKMGDQLSNMVSTKKDKVLVEEISDSVELF